MMNRKLQTSAKPAEGQEDTRTQDQKEYDAGHGGSYSMDPVTRQVTLVERTQEGRVSQKAEGVTRHIPAADAAPAQPAGESEQPAA